MRGDAVTLSLAFSAQSRDAMRTEFDIPIYKVGSVL